MVRGDREEEIGVTRKVEDPEEGEDPTVGKISSTDVGVSTTADPSRRRVTVGRKGDEWVVWLRGFRGVIGLLNMLRD